MPARRAPRRCRHPGLGSDERRPAGRAGRSARGFSSCARRASGRSPGCAPPFSAGGAAMCLDRSGIERQRDGVPAKPGKRLEDLLPAAALGPAIEAIVYGRIGTIFRWAVPPARARLQYMNDSADDAPVVAALRSRQSRRNMRLDTRPLLVTKPKQPVAHDPAPRITTTSRESQLGD